MKPLLCKLAAATELNSWAAANYFLLFYTFHCISVFLCFFFFYESYSIVSRWSGSWVVGYIISNMKCYCCTARSIMSSIWRPYVTLLTVKWNQFSCHSLRKCVNNLVIKSNQCVRLCSLCRRSLIGAASKSLSVGSDHFKNHSEIIGFICIIHHSAELSWFTAATASAAAAASPALTQQLTSDAALFIFRLGVH